MSSIKNLEDNTVQARKMFSSGCRPRLKNRVVLKLSHMRGTDVIIKLPKVKTLSAKAVESATRFTKNY